ncbi:DUF2231 domain-containing protein [Frankia sp. AiPs1]|uniref:DUF2231 domain-containing protein n=1 Tax=Frankia sp. AiPa1 TaxID=573492 RepID=UPI00202AD6B4|nr:DUF2231 domain-containing protein [Frankia sp. AiPa1]MCL9758551.1 hypothetical protein [Frankia sp. AiPa1]
MGPTEIRGLPAHVLLVHVVVVLVPVAAAMVVCSALWPAARRRLGVATPLVTFVALVSVPLTTHAGEWLEARVPSTPLIRQHTELGDSLLPWVGALFVLAAGLWLLQRRAAPATAAADTTRHRAGRSVPTAVTITVAVLSVAVAVGSIVQVVRIGESGAKATWTNNFSTTPSADRRP